MALISEEKFKERSSTAEHPKVKVIDLNEDTDYEWDNYLVDLYEIEEKYKPLTVPGYIDRPHIQLIEKYSAVPVASLLLDHYSIVQEFESSNGTISERVSSFNTTVRKLKVANIIVPGEWVTGSPVVAMINHFDPGDILAVDSGFFMLLQTYFHIKQMSIHAEYLENHFSRRFNTALRRLTICCKVLILLTNSGFGGKEGRHWTRSNEMFSVQKENADDCDIFEMLNSFCVARGIKIPRIAPGVHDP